VGEPVCADERANNGEPFFFLYATVFKWVKLCLPLTGFERALLTEINVAPAQLHPNNWAFLRVFGILCNHFGHTPFVDVFLYFFEAKSPGKKPLGELQQGGRESSPHPVSTFVQGLQGEIPQGMLQ